MVTAIGKQIGRPGPLHNERCLPYKEVFDSLTTMGPEINAGVAISAIRFQVSKMPALLDESGKTPEDNNLHVADQSISLHWTGCIPEHEHVEQVERLVVLDCPSDASLRCAGCMINHTFGQRVIDTLKPFSYDQ